MVSVPPWRCARLGVRGSTRFRARRGLRVTFSAIARPRGQRGSVAALRSSLAPVGNESNDTPPAPPPMRAAAAANAIQGTRTARPCGFAASRGCGAGGGADSVSQPLRSRFRRSGEVPRGAALRAGWLPWVDREQCGRPWPRAWFGPIRKRAPTQSPVRRFESVCNRRR